MSSASRRRALVLASVAILGAAAACLRGGGATKTNAPELAPTRTLGPEGEVKPKPPAKELAVVFARPQGAVVDPSEISIVWNRPMRALELAGEESAPPAVVTRNDGAPVDGAWRWMGTSAVIFAPKSALPRASEFTVKIPKGTKALDGSSLADDYSFSFTTAPPKLLDLRAVGGADHLLPKSTFELRFNQPVELSEVERHTRVSVGGVGDPSAKVAGAGKARDDAWSFKASWEKPNVKTLVKLTPSAPFPLDTKVDVTVDGKLHGTEGPLTLGLPRSISLSTYGPLTATGIECSRDTPNKQCDAENAWLRVNLSNSVKCIDWKAHVRVTPEVPLKWSCNDYPFTTMYVPAKLAPATKYVVTVTAGLRDVYGQALAADASFPVQTDDRWPSVDLGVEGVVFEAGKTSDGRPVAPYAPPARVVPVSSVNLETYDLLAAAADEATVAQYYGLDSNRESLFDEIAALTKGTVEQVTPKGVDNVSSVRTVPLDVLLGKGGHGAAIIGVRSPGHRPWRSDSEVTLVAATDLAISARMSRFGSVVWVTRLSDGQPVARATVAVRDKTGKERFSTTADDDGIALIPADKWNPVHAGEDDDGPLVFARSGDDWTFKRVNDRVDSWRLGVYADVSGRLPPIGMLFTERGVYRPGESVKVKGLFRQPRPHGTETPAGRDVHVQASDASGEKIFESDLKLDAFGGFAVEVPVPATAHLGMGEIVAKVDSDVDDHPTGSASASMMLAEFRAAEFKVRVDPEKPAYIRGEAAVFETHGDYLFGAPMGVGTVHFTTTRGRSSFVPPGAEGLVLDDDMYASELPAQNLRAGEMQSGNGALAAKGVYAAKVPLPMPAQHGAEVLTFEAEVTDISRQAIANRASVIVHPGEFYLGLKPATDIFVHKGDTLKPLVGAFEPTGKRREGVKVHLDLVRRSWRSVLEATGEASQHYQSTIVDKVVGSCDLTTTDGAASCDLPVTDAGYLLVRATAKDKRQNTLASSASLYSIGESESDDLGWRMSDTLSVELVPNKKSYEVGETATVLVKNPFKEATALVTVERSGIYHQERQTLKGPMPTLAIPITDDLRPNAYVSVQLVRGRSEAAPALPAAGRDLSPDKGAPTFRVGYANLSINPEARRLKVQVTPAKRSLGPGDMLDADLSVVDRDGKPVASTVTFYAVDLGVLMLTDYRTPDPIPTFTAPRSLAVFTLESRDALARLLINPNGGAGPDKGSEGGGGGSSSVRSDFRATAYFDPSLATGKDGRAHVSFKLPDSLTTYRLMAVVAAADDRFGFGEAEVITSRPLMARPAMPRFLRAGDTIDAGIIVTSKGLPPGNVEVGLAASGVTVSGDPKRTVAVPATRSVEVRWPISAPRSGKSDFTFSVRGLGDGAPHDEVKVSRDVEVPLSPEAVALYGETSGISAEQLGDLSSMRDDTGGLDLRLASTALIGLDDGIEQLIKYPYGCTEQLTSRLVPLVPLVSLAADYHVELPENLDHVIDETVAKILKNQQSDGSFGWWVDSREGDPWLTAYALWGLTIAKNAGHAVPDDALSRATSAVRSALAMWNKNDWTREIAAFELDVLAMVGSPDPGYMDLLFEKRATLPVHTKALLEHALVLSQGATAKAQIDELDRDLESHLRVTAVGATVEINVGTEYATLMDSEAWATAIVLRTLVARDPSHPLAGRIAKGLLALRRGGTWRSTEETAWSLLALDDYRHAQEKDVPSFDAKVSLGGLEVLTAPFKGRSTHTASASLPAAKLFEGQGRRSLAFDVEGAGKLFYEARLRYAKKELPHDPLDRGFNVRKLVRSLRPEELSKALAVLPSASAATANAGDLVLVDLLVVTPDAREQVVLEDPLPAGVEAVDARLATSARSLDVAEAGGAGDESNGDTDDDSRANGLVYNEVWYHREIRDDRVLTFIEHMPAGMYHFRYLARATTVGTFVVPPTRAECMYEPETFGRTAGSAFEVKSL